MKELSLTDGKDKDSIVPVVRAIAFGIMNANVRVDFNSEDVLSELLRLAETSTSRALASYKTNH